MNNMRTFYYNRDTVEAYLPDKATVREALLSQEKAVSSGIELVRNAVSSPLGCAPIKDFLKIDKEESVLIIINDQTRPTPTRTVLEAITWYLPIDQVLVLVATGIHRGPSVKELEKIYGTAYPLFRDRTIIHDARDKNSLENLGTTPSGTKVLLNKAVNKADKIIVIGSVEPHYFAGYTGGRKGFFPGVSGFETIESNHRLALDPNAKSLQLSGNPVHEDMMDAMAFLKKKSIFSIMTVLDCDHNIFAVTAGNDKLSFDAAVEIADRVFVSELDEKFDVVISVAKDPMDLDLYQSQKAIDNGKLALKENGILILLSACLDGPGAKSFIEILNACETPQDVLEKIKKEYKLGWHKASKMAEVFHSNEVWAVTELEDDLLKSIFIQPYRNLQKAIDDAVSIKGENLSILIIPDGCITVPRVKNKGEAND